MAQQEHAYDAHEDDSQVVLLSAPGLEVNGHLAHGLSTSTLAELNVLVDLPKQVALQ